MQELLTHMILLELVGPESFPSIADSNVFRSESRDPCPAVSRIEQFPRVRPSGKPFFSIYFLRLFTIVSVGLSETPWNFLNPVTWIVTDGGPSDPIYQWYFLDNSATTERVAKGKLPPTICKIWMHLSLLQLKVQFSVEKNPLL